MNRQIIYNFPWLVTFSSQLRVLCSLIAKTESAIINRCVCAGFQTSCRQRLMPVRHRRRSLTVYSCPKASQVFSPAHRRSAARCQRASGLFSTKLHLSLQEVELGCSPITTSPHCCSTNLNICRDFDSSSSIFLPSVFFYLFLFSFFFFCNQFPSISWLIYFN